MPIRSQITAKWTQPKRSLFNESELIHTINLLSANTR